MVVVMGLEVGVEVGVEVMVVIDTEGMDHITVNFTEIKTDVMYVVI